MIVVDAGGNGNYETLSAAIDAITAASESNRYKVLVFGDIDETETIIAKSHVDVIGTNNTITITSTGSGHGLLLDSVTDCRWEKLTVVRAGVVTSPSVSAIMIDGSCDSTVVLGNVTGKNITTPDTSQDHLTGFVVQGTATPTLINCEGIGSNAAYYGHGMWWREGAGGVARNCVGRGGANGSAINNWGIYIVANANPLLIDCAGYGSNSGNNCHGTMIRGAATPTLVNLYSRGGDGGTGCHGLQIDDAALPVFIGGTIHGGIYSGGSSHCIVIGNLAAPQMYSLTALPRQFSDEVTIAATTSFSLVDSVSHQIKAVSMQVDVAGTGGATIAIGTTPGGSEIVAATAITSTGVLYPALVDAGAEPQLAAGATIYVTITGTGTPSVRVWFGGEYAPTNCYGALLGGSGAFRADGCRFIGNCYSSYGMVVGTNTRTANVMRVTRCHIEARRKKTGSGAAIYTSAAYANAPLYQCTIVGAATNITAAAGVANGTNVVI